MASSYSKLKGRGEPTFVMLRFDMMDTPAWLALPAAAQALWFHIRRRYWGWNNGEIPLSCREAALKLHISKTTAGHMFQELIDKGFIKVGKDSSFNYKTKASRRWTFTDVPLGEVGPTSDWRKWKLSPDSERTIPDS